MNSEIDNNPLSNSRIQTVDGVILRVDSNGITDDEAALREPVDAGQVELCARWLSQATPAPTPTLNSFWVKHVIEQWAGEPISNGSLILAAQRCGIAIGYDAGNGSNVLLGLDSQSVDHFDCGCGHP